VLIVINSTADSLLSCHVCIAYYCKSTLHSPSKLLPTFCSIFHYLPLLSITLLLFLIFYTSNAISRGRERERERERESGREVAHVPSFIIAKSTFSQFRLVMIKAHIAIEYQLYAHAMQCLLYNANATTNCPLK